MAKTIAERSCMFCRSKGHKKGLIRFVLDGGKTRLDLNNRLPGRGAYLCRSRQCVIGALAKKGLFSKAFKKEADQAYIKAALDSAKDVLISQ